VGDAEIIPGQGVKIETSAGPNQGTWVIPTATNEAEVTHVVGFEQTTLNTNLAVPSGNANSDVTFPAESIGIKAMPFGSVFVVAGATIVAGERLQFDAGTFTVIPNATTGNLISIVALENAEVEDVLAVRIAVIG